MTAERIDLTPTWAALVPIFVALLTDPQAKPETIRDVRDQLLQLARFVDAHNTRAKEAQQ